MTLAQIDAIDGADDLETEIISIMTSAPTPALLTGGITNALSGAELTTWNSIVSEAGADDAQAWLDHIVDELN